MLIIYKKIVYGAEIDLDELLNDTYAKVEGSFDSFIGVLTISKEMEVDVELLTLEWVEEETEYSE